ncbi:probable cytochrome P450 6a20 [Diorhabda sublineata]|uniref:probable cytochrome P450 6a20 n=1 Tax=Diorhabda sublineata TaxID=1163346 RepID=UPI0024E0B4A4|nr:probable cytochrome P450 6a20 [Diorhabda sublineata]
MWLVLLVLVITLVLICIKRQYSYWERNGIPGPKPIPIAGNFYRNFVGKISAGEIITEIYNKYEGYPFVGIYRATSPVLLVRDPDFVKNIFVRDFKHFHDNDIEIDKEVDPIFGRNPFVMKGDEWKSKRAQLTTLFTSGKIKGMYQFLLRSSNRMVQYIEDETKSSNEFEAREICVRFALDNVAACAFGLEGKSFDEPYSQFRELADNFISPDGIRNKIIGLLFVLCPSFFKKMKFKLVPKDVEDKLMEIVKSSLKYRRDNNIVRNDFLDAVSSLQKEDGLFTSVDIVANAASFFGDGYETSSRVMAFLVFELAANPDIQDKLRNEINTVLENNDNSLNYEVIQNMKYLDACLSESLRKNSIVHNLNKICTEDYTYTPTNPDFKNITVKIKAGESVVVPLTGLQMDPKYFDEPQKFKPERFLGPISYNRSTYLPFGDGQRVCLGQRFAQTQIKVGIANIIKNFRLKVSSKTKLPLKLDPYFIMRHAIGGLWVHFEKIQ